MSVVIVRFYGELNGFLPARRYVGPVHMKLDAGQTVQDIIESAGIPCNRVDLILVNDRPAAFTSELHPYDRITLYPEFRCIDISPMNLISRHRIH